MGHIGKELALGLGRLLRLAPCFFRLVFGSLQFLALLQLRLDAAQIQGADNDQKHQETENPHHQKRNVLDSLGSFFLRHESGHEIIRAGNLRLEQQHVSAICPERTGDRHRYLHLPVHGAEKAFDLPALHETDILRRIVRERDDDIPLPRGNQHLAHVIIATNGKPIRNSVRRVQPIEDIFDVFTVGHRISKKKSLIS